jgi:3',5'-cyclic AMP phosphodiesterase CpdA
MNLKALWHRQAVLTSVLAATLLLTGCSDNPRETTAPPERLLLQQMTPRTVLLKWRGAAGSVCVSDANHALDPDSHCFGSDVGDGGHHEARVSGLRPDSLYEYSVAGFASRAQTFRTPPEKGHMPEDGEMILWVLGDSGTASKVKDGKPAYPDEAASVREGFLTYMKSRGETAPDLVVLLGDNAYPNGTDEEWQTGFFDIYPTVLSRAPVIPTIGNHEMGSMERIYGEHGAYFGPGSSVSSDPNSYVSVKGAKPSTMPYLHIFSLPRDGELGGSASGTEQYFSASYGNLHLISLDSQLAMRSAEDRERMKEWLIRDLSANESKWTVVIFHHPPYSKGGHDSDREAALLYEINAPIVHVREEFTPIFESFGVDLVMSGHSHSYERSYQLAGHRGDAENFRADLHAARAADGTLLDGRGETLYRKSGQTGSDSSGVVYIVLGSSGHAGLDRGPFGKGTLRHPAHVPQPDDPQKRRGLASLGSLVLHLKDNQLTGRFINETGTILDEFTISDAGYGQDSGAR